MGYRRIRDELDKKYGVAVNDKRVLRICRKERIQSTIKWKPKGCTRNSVDPAHIARNYLNRDFHADAPNVKWLTDVTEFKYYIGIEVHKVYLFWISMTAGSWLSKSVTATTIRLS